MREKQRNKTNLHHGVLTVLLVLLSALLIPAKVLHAEGEGEEKGYLTFTSEKSFTITPNGRYTNLEYTTGDAPTETTVWTNATQKSTIIASPASDGKYYIYFRGLGNNVITGYNTGGLAWKMTDTDGAGIACLGNIEALLDYYKVKNGEHPAMGMFSFYDMFFDCTCLITAPDLPAETVTMGGYCTMFYGCTGLKEAPDLPAESLDEGCYCGMFAGCTSLKEAPVLPAKTLAEYCYSSMFQECTGLTKAPALPAKELTDGCYSGMFVNCTSLKEAPVLSAETLAPQCYVSMFSGCTKLKMSEQKTDDYPVEFIITGDSDYYDWNKDMFEGTGGTFTGDPERGKTYYVPNSANVPKGYTYYATYEGCDFYRSASGNTRCYEEATGAEVYNAFKCDGTYTYYFQYDRTAMRDRLTYHPDGKHIIYFDKDGHEVFSDYGHITTSIAGDKVDDYCFFDVHGYMYVDVMTYDITGTKIYYANPYGVLEHTGWFTFSDGGYGYANGDMSLLTDQHTYDWNGNLVYMEADGHIRGTGDGRNLWPVSSL